KRPQQGGRWSSGRGWPMAWPDDLAVVVAGATIVVTVMPAIAGHDDATRQGQYGQQGNQQCDSTKHFSILKGTGNMTRRGGRKISSAPVPCDPDLPRTSPYPGMCLALALIHSGYNFSFRIPAMTQSQRLKYSILISLAVLGIMFGLSYLQNSGVISEKTFQYIAIAVAVIVVVINGVMRRKVKP
ncbi:MULTISPECIES: hypothetical protein, partial [unclassified Pseudomonas]